jgi:hypothetical protein
MGCDIHTIVEIKVNNEWKLVEDLPIAFETRNYGVFSILNRNVRNSYDIKGFSGKGKPIDTKNLKARFYSYGEDIRMAYEKETRYCKIVKENGEIEYLATFDSSLLTEIDRDLYNRLSKEMTKEELKRYDYPYLNSDGKAQVYDAQVVGGEFVSIPYSEIYPTIKEFNDAVYHYPWYEEEQDFGYYEFDLTSRDYHSHSYLDLAELKTKTGNLSKSKTFWIDEEFLKALSIQLDGDLDFLTFGCKKDGKQAVNFIENDTFYIWQNYENGVKDLEIIKKKYNIEKDEDIRIVFAFDS